MGTNVSAALASSPVSLNMQTPAIWEPLVFCYILKKTWLNCESKKDVKNILMFQLVLDFEYIYMCATKNIALKYCYWNFSQPEYSVLFCV